jgi:hypothetical protein
LVEQLIRNQQVTGSSPVIGSRKIKIEAAGNSGFVCYWLMDMDQLLCLISGAVWRDLSFRLKSVSDASHTRFAG